MPTIYIPRFQVPVTSTTVSCLRRQPGVKHTHTHARAHTHIHIYTTNARTRARTHTHSLTYTQTERERDREKRRRREGERQSTPGKKNGLLRFITGLKHPDNHGNISAKQNPSNYKYCNVMSIYTARKKQNKTKFHIHRTC